MAEGLEGGHVDDACAVDRLAGGVGPVELVDAHEEPGEGLARPGGGGDQDVAPAADERPAPALRGRGLAQPLMVIFDGAPAYAERSR